MPPGAGVELEILEGLEKMQTFDADERLALLADVD